MKKAREITKSSGQGGLHVQDMIQHVRDLRNFASNKSDEFYSEAQKHKNNLIQNLVFTIGIVALFILIISYFLLHNIKTTLNELSKVASKHIDGNLTVRSQYCSKNEFGILSDAFNKLSDSIQDKIETNENARIISNTMLKNNDFDLFFMEFLKSLLENTNSQIGAIYFLSEDQTKYQLREAIGLSENADSYFSADIMEGEFGLAIAKRNH